MRLLLDAMYPAEVADQLRAAGHDVLAAQEDRSLTALDDQEMFQTAQRLGRALVTENVKDLLPIAASHGRERAHYGLVLTSDRRFPRGRRDHFIGAMVRALDHFLRGRTSSGPTSLVAWLEEAP